MYEHRRHRLLSPAAFRGRLARHGLMALALVGVALACGVVGYRATTGMPWIDALLNAAMILSGMGPVETLRSDAAKLFASFYALFSAFALILVAGILIAPVAHRILHRLHLDETDGETADTDARD